MQDEVNTKVIAIAIKGGKITAEVLERHSRSSSRKLKRLRSKPVSQRPTKASSPSSTLSSRMPPSTTSK